MTATEIEQRYWEDVAEEERLGGYSLELTWTKMAEQVSGSQDFYAVHHDPDFAREGAPEDIFYNTGFTGAALCRLLTDWHGPQSWLRKLSFEMRKGHMPRDTIRVQGIVTARREGEGGMGEVDIDLRVANDRVSIATPIEATVLLPRASRG